MTTETYPEKIRSEDLPLWMRQARQSVDWGILTTLWLCVLLGWAFILQDSLPVTNASENYVYMTENYAEAMHEGRLYPRWAAPALDGYGAPIPHYFPPGAPYTAALIEVLFTADAVVAVRILYVVSLALAGMMTYAFVTRLMGAAAGVLAAVLYVYSPYVGMTAPHMLGDLPGVMTLAFYPLLLWSLHRLLTVRRVFDFALVAVSGAAIVLAKPEAVTIALGAVVLLCGWHLWEARGRLKRRVWLVIGAGLFAAGLSAFYWLPALLERNLVRWQPQPYATQMTVSPFDLITPLQRVDLNALVAPPQFTLGVGLLVFSIAGTGMLWRRRAVLPLLFGVGAFVLAFVLWLLPTQTWLVGPLSLCLAVVGAGTIDLAERLPRLRRLLLPLLLMFALGLALPVWLSPVWSADNLTETGAPAQIRYEQLGYGVAALPPNDTVPTTLADDDIQPSLALTSSYADENIVRLPTNQLGLGRQASLLAGETHSDRYIVSTQALGNRGERGQVTFDLLRAYFAGWQATIDGDEVPLRRDTETGLMRVFLRPVQSALLTVSLGSTPVRLAGWILFWVSLVLVSTAAIFRLRRQGIYYYNDLQLLTKPEARLVGLIAVGFTVGMLVFARSESPFALHAPPGHALSDGTTLRARTLHGLELVAYDVDNTTVEYGDKITVKLAWRAVSPQFRNYHVSVHLTNDVSSVRWSKTMPAIPGSYPVRRWTSDRYVLATYEIELLPNVIPPDVYQVGVEVYQCNDGDCPDDGRSTFVSANGQSVGPVLPLPTQITVE